MTRDIPGLAISQAESSAQIALVRELFLEYAESLGFSLCFQNFDAESAGLPGDYAPPKGRLLLAYYEAELAGCVALHELDSWPDGMRICEMKRLYVRPQFRGKAVGRALIESVIAEARQVAYASMRLDTVEPVMKTALAMYRRFGFHEIAPYCANPIEGAVYMELIL